jgi:hypothetical protein
MSVEDGNGELRQLLEVKRAYRDNVVAFERELKTKYERELADGKKRFKEQYLERIVDVVFAEETPTHEPKPEPVAQPEVEVKKPSACPECETPVNPEDKFCSQCAYPLTEPPGKEADMNEWPVVSAGRRLRSRRRS